MKKFLNSTASVALCLSMALPRPVLAQTSGVGECAPKKKDRSFPCLTESGEIAEDATAFRELSKEARKGDASTRGDAVAQTPIKPAQTEAIPADDQAVALSAIAPSDENQTPETADTGASAPAAAGAVAPEGTSADALAKDVAEAPEPVDQEAQTPVVQSENRPAAPAQTAAASNSPASAANPQSPEAQRPEDTGETASVQPMEEMPAAAAAAAAADAQPSTNVPVSGDVDVSTEEVTAENTRSSDEEFATTADGTPAPASVATAPGDDDDGLSNFEKALLLGLGAVVVGKVLDNGDEVVSRSGDRVVVERDGELRVLKNDDTLLRQPGSKLRTETFNDGSTRTTVDREDGSQIVTIRAAEGRVLSRTRITPEGEAIVIFDDTAPEPQIDVAAFPSTVQETNSGQEDALTRALQAELGVQAQSFSLRQIRNIKQVRALAPEIELTNIQFETGSAAIRPAQARSLARIGTTITDIIDADPRSVVLIEGHTDAVGGAAYNLALSDRRAETVALALTEYFDVPPENLIVQGYGESVLKVPTNTAERANRRAVVRNITPLLR